MSISEFQILNMVLTTKDIGLLKDNLIDKDCFVEASKEYEYLTDFYNVYNCVPDKETFLASFPNFKLFTVEESSEAVINRIREENLFRKTVTVFNKASELISADANKGVQYLRSAILALEPNYSIKYTNIIAQAQERYDIWEDRFKNPELNYIGMPFKELEHDLYGFRRGSELFLFLAKSSMGKSQVLTACAEYASSQGHRVGLISPEMDTLDIAYRFDTSRGHFSNKALQNGDAIVGYKKYIEELKNTNEALFVADINDFNRQITIQKVENFIKQLKLDILFIDGLSYVKPDEITKGSTTADILGQTCVELLSLSTAMKIPIVCVVQARRRSSEKRDEDLAPDSESIYNSYQITQVATRIVSLNRVGPAMSFSIAKNRYGRDSGDGRVYIYNYDFDVLRWNFIPTLQTADSMQEESNVEQEDMGGIF